MGLCMHMVPLLARIKSGMRMKNPDPAGYQAGVSAGLQMATQACSVLQDISEPIKGGRDRLYRRQLLRWHWNGRRPRVGT